MSSFTFLLSAKNSYSHHGQFPIWKRCLHDTEKHFSRFRSFPLCPRFTRISSLDQYLSESVNAVASRHCLSDILRRDDKLYNLYFF